MSYGTPTADTGSKYLNAGVHPVKIESVELTNINSESYNGPAIDVNYVGEDGEANDRFFPLRIDWKTTEFNDKFAKYDWFQKSFPDLKAFLDHERGQTVTNKVRDILNCYMTEEEVENFFAEVGSLIQPGATEEAAFLILGQQFAKAFANNPAYSQKEVFLARGYTYNKDFVSGPKEAKHCKPWIFPEPFNFKGGKQFQLTPFGNKDRGATPAQDQQVEEDF